MGPFFLFDELVGTIEWNMVSWLNGFFVSGMNSSTNRLLEDFMGSKVLRLVGPFRIGTSIFQREKRALTGRLLGRPNT